ncbi:MAG: crotonase/enoyl-CoA hydratase family protein [Actinomycetota bacterium]|nr:crotonase/enoyl-CoA hydratase family protein [Actinomycetota bacterium]
MSDEVLYEVEGRIATITLNRPDQRNAINPEVTAAMNAVMERFESDPEIWLAILTGAGSTFSAGADLKVIAAGRAAELSAGKGGFGGFVRYPRTKPVIAAVNGFALAGGTELVLACDLVVAAREAAFGLPEVTRGIVAVAGGVFRLPRAIPPARARELIMTGDRLGAEEAHRLGLVNHLVAADEVLPTARRLGERICQNAPLAVRESLAIARAALNIDEDEGWSRSAAASTRIRQTEDAKEGPRAFAEKRPPRWTGR